MSQKPTSSSEFGSENRSQQELEGQKSFTAFKNTEIKML